MPTLNERDRQRLKGVHPDLVRVIEAAVSRSPWPVMVIEGLRSPERQAALKAEGKSKTLNSRHLTGHAVDIAPVINGSIPWDQWELFEDLADLVKAEAKRLGVTLVWGGDWPRFRDGPHYELDRKRYPVAVAELPLEAQAEPPYAAPPPPASAPKVATAGLSVGGAASGLLTNLDRFSEVVQIAIIVLIALAGVGAFVAYKKGWLK